MQLHKSYWVFIEHCLLALRRRVESGGRGAKEKTLFALRSPPSGRKAIQRLFPRMSCEAALATLSLLQKIRSPSSAPEVFLFAEAMIEFVGKTPGAIGFIPASQAQRLERCKIVRLE